MLGLTTIVKRIPPIKRVIVERDHYRAQLQALGYFPPGHYYSPFPDLEQIHRDRGRIFENSNASLGGIDLNESGQVELIEKLKTFYRELPFSEGPSPSFRYYLDNEYYAYSDGILLYCLLRHLRPRLYVEIGSGYSSACAMDTDQHFLGGK